MRPENQAFDKTDALAAIGLDPTVGTRRKLRELTRRAYDDVVKLLKPFAAVIFLFVIPQIVGLTGCKNQDPGRPHPRNDQR